MRRVPVEAILQRVPQRATAVYRALLDHPDTQHDPVTGWSYAYLTQAAMAEQMHCAQRTISRAVADLRTVGVCRVLTWPSATTETSLRVADVAIPVSIFGPVQRIQEIADPGIWTDLAIAKLIQEYDEILWDIELAFADYSGGST